MSESRPSASTLPSTAEPDVPEAVERDPVAPDAGEEAEATDAAASSPIVIPDDDAEDEPEPVASAPVVVGQGDVEVDCPGCGLSVVGDSPRPTAAWFCPRCDYPLFWVSEPPAATPPSRRARRRLPGTGGTVVLGSETCWHCGEMNEPGVVECLRCAATLPKPVPPAVPVVHVPVPVRTPVPVRMVTWPYVAAASCAGGAIAMTVTLWLGG